MILKTEILEFQVFFVHGDNHICHVAIFVWENKVHYKVDCRTRLCLWWT